MARTSTKDHRQVEEVTAVLQFSDQAAALMRQTREFDHKDFAEWMMNRPLAIDAERITEYLMQRDEEERGGN